MITQQQLKELLHYCPETGVWTWLVDRGGMRKGDVAGCIMASRGKKYIYIGVLGYRPRAHRLAFLYMNGAIPENDVDHEDGNGLNNRWSNLRAVTPAGNAKNQRLHSSNVSGKSGVSWHKRDSKWQAMITVNGRKKQLGYFSSKEEAIAAREAAEIEFGYHKNHGTNRPL